MESDESENVSGLELHEADEHPGAPPGVLAEGVQQRQGVGGEVEQREEEHGGEHQRDRRRVQEQHREYQVVRRVLGQEQPCGDTSITTLHPPQ